MERSAFPGQHSWPPPSYAEQQRCYEILDSFASRRSPLRREEVEQALAARPQSADALLKLEDAVRALECERVWQLGSDAVTYRQAIDEFELYKAGHRNIEQTISRMPAGPEKDAAQAEETVRWRALRRQHRQQTMKPYKRLLTAHYDALRELDELRERIGLEIAALYQDEVWRPERCPGAINGRTLGLYDYVGREGRQIIQSGGGMAQLTVSGRGYVYTWRGERFLLVPVHAVAPFPQRWPLLRGIKSRGSFVCSGPHQWSGCEEHFLRTDLQWAGYRDSLCKHDSRALLGLRLTNNCRGRFAFGRWGNQGLSDQALAFDLERMELTEVEDLAAFFASLTPPEGLAL